MSVLINDETITNEVTSYRPVQYFGLRDVWATATMCISVSRCLKMI